MNEEEWFSDQADDEMIAALQKAGRFVVAERRWYHIVDDIMLQRWFHKGDFATLDEANECLKLQVESDGKSDYLVLQPSRSNALS
jgi:hypothetical protein